MSAQQDQQLVERSQNGDQQALGQLLESYQHRLFSVALRMLGNRDDAAEITQDAMLKVVSHIGSYDGRASISTWMIRIVMNLSISHLRKRRLRLTASLDAPMGGGNGHNEASSLSEQLPDNAELGPDSSVQKHEMIEKMHQCLGAMDEEFRAVIILRDLNEMDYQAISEVLQIPIGTVKSRLFRARLALRKAMARFVNPPSKRHTESTTPRMGGLADA